MIESFEELENQIKDCTKCKLHQNRTNIVLGCGNRNAKVEEITKEQFDTYMAENKNTVITKLMEPVLEAEILNGEKPEQYLEVTNKYYEISKGVKLESKVKYQEPDKDDSSKMVDATKNYVFEFKNKSL